MYANRFPLGVEQVFIGGVYPRAGANLGEKTTAPGEEVQAQNAVEAGIEQVVPHDNPLGTLFFFIIMLVVLMFVTARWGVPGEYANIRASFYNVFIIGLAAATFIPLLKLAAVKFPGPWTSFILAI